MLKELGIENVIDCHSHSGGTDMFNYFSGNLPHSQSVSDLMMKVDQTGVNKIVTFPFPGSVYYDTKIMIANGNRIPSGLEEFPYQFENRTIVHDCDQHNGRVLPFACIDPTTEVSKQIEYLQSLKDRRKIFGLKLHTLACGCSAGRLVNSGFAEFAQTNDLPIMVHSGLDELSHPSNVLTVGRQYRDLRLCVAHMAALDGDVIDQISKTDNIFVDCAPFLQFCHEVLVGDTSVCYPNLIDPTNPADSLFKYYNKLRNNLVWGTDEPWTTSIESDGTIRSKHTYADEVGVIVDLFHISEKAVAAITNQNTMNFLFG